MLRPMMKKRWNYKGFLLIHVTIVVALLLIIMSIMVGQFTFMRKRLVRAELEKLHSLCNYVYHIALMTHKEQAITFDEKNHEYRWAHQHVRLGRGIEFGVVPGMQGPPSSPTKRVDNAITFKGKTLRINADGSMQPGTVYLRDAQQTYQYALTVPIADYSYVRTYNFDRTWKVLS